ncbi:MAG: cadherin-like beta sandwich domain-containing protein [Bacilli bacterium]|nr:cadherin-like beta sandwich domain-containing protein [Bacilli bacterium]
MKNKLKFSLLLMILMLIPTCVFAASIEIGSAKNEDGKASWSVVYKGDKLSTGDVFNLNAYGNDNGMVTCSVTYSSPLLETGAVAADKEVPSSGLTIGTLKCETTSTENQPGSVGIKGTLKTASGTVDLNMSPKTYTVNAQRKKSSDAKLKTITVSQGTMTPEFKSDKFEYTVYNLKDTINSIRITWTCDYCTGASSNAHAEKKGNNSINFSELAKGNNDIELEITSEDGSNKETYKLTVIRGETEYNSAKVSSLSFGDSNLIPEFKEDTLEGYTVSVPNDVKDISKIASVVLKDPEAKYEFIGGDNLSIGANEVELKVTSVLGDNEVSYKITVTRLNSDNITLVSYKDNQITFIDADKAEQTLSAEEFEKAYPNVWKDIQSGKYKFDENGKLIENKTEKKSNKKVIVIIIVLVVGVIVIGLSGYFIFRKKDPEKEKEKIKKKAMKKARKDELKKLEEEYYKEYYNEDYEDGEEYENESEDESEDESEEVEEETPEEETEEIPSRSKKNKEQSLLEDDYIFEQSLLEEENEESEENTKTKKKEDVVDVDTALEDLMNTKTYDFSDEFEDLDK